VSARPSPRSLEQTPQRAFVFLRGVGTCPAIREALAAHEYTPEEHARGWALLEAASGHPLGALPSASERARESEVRAAIATIVKWAPPAFRRLRALLRRAHPEALDRLLAGITATRGFGAVGEVQALLDRLDELEREERALPLLATLAARGFTKSERDRLRTLVTTVQRAPLGVGGSTDTPDFDEALIALYRWVRDWSETAHTVIVRRDHLIRLGIARRKPSAT